MGKTGKWFRSLLGGSKKSEEKKKKKQQQKRLIIKSNNVEEDPQASPYVHGLDANRHAIAVAAATAAVAEAALAAAQAAAEVVRMTSGGGSVRCTAAAYVSGERRRVLAAVKIQSGYRAYLARRALKALKGLVKLQALVRGHIVRRQSADMLRRMQAMARIQARASANRAHTSDSSYPKIKGFENIRKYEQRSGSSKNRRPVLEQYNSRSRNSNNVNKEISHKPFDWLDHWMQQCKLKDQQNTLLQTGCGDDERNDKILEIDTWKPRQNPRSRNDISIPTSHYFSAWNEMGQEYTRTGSLSRLSAKLQKPNPSISSEEVSSIMSSKFPPEGDSPRVHSAMSRPTGNARTPFTPARSECSRSLFGDYLGHPSYMAYTESSRAKVRSQSAPKQRMQLEELGLSSKFGRSLWESDTISEKGSILPDKNRSNAYLQSGQYKRQGTPIYNGALGLNTSYGH